MYSAVFLGWPTTIMRPKRETSTPTWSMDVAITASTAPVPSLRSPSFEKSMRCLCWAASRSSSATACRRTVVSMDASKDTSSRDSTSVMSAEEMREVSSWTDSISVRRRRRFDSPLRVPWIRTRVAMSSSRKRRIPASSRVALK